MATQNRWIYLSISFALLASACRPRNSASEQKNIDLNGHVVTERVKVGGEVEIDLTKGNENFVEITVDKPGILEFMYQLAIDRKFPGLTTPIEYAVYFQEDTKSPLFFHKVDNVPKIRWDQIVVTVDAVKPGSYFFMIKRNEPAKEQMSGYGNFRPQLIEKKPATSNKLLAGKLLSFTDHVPKKLVIELPDVDDLVNVLVTTMAHVPSDKPVGNAGCTENCVQKLTIVDADGKRYGTEAFGENPIGGTSERQYQQTFFLKKGKKFLEYEITNVPDNGMVNFRASVDSFRSRTQKKIRASDGFGIKNYKAEDQISDNGSYVGAPFGYAVKSNFKSPAKLNVSVELNKIVNLTHDSVFPDKLNVTIEDLDGKKQFEIETPSLYWPRRYEGEVEVNVGVGELKVTVEPTSIPNGTPIRMALYVGYKFIQDGGPSLNNFKDLTAVTTTPPNKYLDDRQVPDDAVFAAPVPSGRALFSPVTQSSDIAARSVLEGMEKIRNNFHIVVPIGVTPVPSSEVDRSNVYWCLQNEARHWSDLTMHYYCQLGLARNCYTNTIREKATALAKELGSPPKPEIVAKLQKIRLEAWEKCSAKASAVLDDTEKQQPLIVEEQRQWKWIVDEQKDVFQYVMNAQTFAFDMQQQQDIINKFYRIDNPASKKECIRKRPVRAIDPKDGTHCLANKVMPTVLQSEGR